MLNKFLNCLFVWYKVDLCKIDLYKKYVFEEVISLFDRNFYCVIYIDIFCFDFIYVIYDVDFKIILVLDINFI